MLRATLRSLLARKLRLLLSGVAVILGVAFVSGTFVLTDSLSRVFDQLFATVNAGSAVDVRAAALFSSTGRGPDAAPEPVPEAVLTAVRAVPGVAEALGQVSGYAQVVDRAGRPVATGGAPTLGVSMAGSSRQESLRVKQGSIPATDSEVAVDAVTARRVGLHVGDRVTVLLHGPSQTFRVAAIVGFGTSDNLAGASIVAFTTHGAQRYVGIAGAYSNISIAAASGVSESVLRQRVAAVLPPGVEAVTTTQKVAETSQQVKQGIGFFSTALLVFAGISLFVGAFLIFNTFTMLIAQRTRELALMRALGASRGQVTRSVLVEALVIGVTSSAIGFVLGLGIAAGLRGLLSALGITLPKGQTVIATRTVVVAFVVGIGVTCVAALIPARRAARLSPVEAMRDSGPAEDRSLRRRVVLGSLNLMAGIALLAGGLSNGTLPLLGVGAMLTFLGVTTLSPTFARPVVLALGAPLARLGVPSRLGRGNAARSPRRTSATAAALMVGLALVSAVSVLGASVKSSVRAVVASSIGADFIITPKGRAPLSLEIPRLLAGRPGVATIASFREGSAKAVGKAGGDGRIRIQGVEPASLHQVLRLAFTSGDPAALAKGQLIMDAKKASDEGFRVGQLVPVTWARTGTVPLVLGALFKANNLAGNFLVSDRVFDANTTQPQLAAILVKLSDGVAPAAGRATVDAALAAFPSAQVQDQAQFVRSLGSTVDTLLNAVTLLLVLSIVIAVLGIVNTLALSVVERVRELGLLRAVGLQRRQLRRMIRVESVLIAVYGAVLGLAIGTAMGYALVTALHDQGITEFRVPWRSLLLMMVGAGVAGILAAALPARRAARLSVLEAVSSA
ncbi:MAG: FtsX-like permease family protein [Actinomycetota bacterium]|nr:FtsX-like permease family protein [Actinomycetota bacterium]